MKIASPDHGDQFCTGYRDFFTTGASLPVDHGGDTRVIEEPAGYLNSKGGRQKKTKLANMLLKRGDPPYGSLQAYCLDCAADLHMHGELCLVHTFSIALKAVMKERILWCRKVLAMLR